MVGDELGYALATTRRRGAGARTGAGDREGRGAAWVTEGGRGDDGVGPALVLSAAVAAGMNGGDCHHNRMTDDVGVVRERIYASHTYVSINWLADEATPEVQIEMKWGLTVPLGSVNAAAPRA